MGLSKLTVPYPAPLPHTLLSLQTQLHDTYGRVTGLTTFVMLVVPSVAHKMWIWPQNEPICEAAHQLLKYTTRLQTNSGFKSNTIRMLLFLPLMSLIISHLSVSCLHLLCESVTKALLRHTLTQQPATIENHVT